MASSQTSNYKLNQWAASDKFLRTEFNSDNSKIDAALKALASRDTALDGAKCELVMGSYTGDGTDSREIALGFRPSMVLIVGSAVICVKYASYSWYGAFVQFADSGLNSTYLPTSQGFRVSTQEIADATFRESCTNYANARYHYFAWH